MDECFSGTCVPAGAGGPGREGRGRTVSVPNELQRSVVIQWLLCEQSSILIMNIGNG